MSYFRKKPVVIEAERVIVLLQQSTFTWYTLPRWFRDAYEKGGVVITGHDISLPTLEGTMIAGREDWVICGIKGELYPCKPDIFEATYEAVEEGAIP